MFSLILIRFYMRNDDCRKLFINSGHCQQQIISIYTKVTKRQLYKSDIRKCFLPCIKAFSVTEQAGVQLKYPIFMPHTDWSSKIRTCMIKNLKLSPNTGMLSPDASLFMPVKSLLQRSPKDCSERSLSIE